MTFSRHREQGVLPSHLDRLRLHSMDHERRARQIEENDGRKIGLLTIASFGNSLAWPRGLRIR
jgi:hypothetical protein